MYVYVYRPRERIELSHTHTHYIRSCLFLRIAARTAVTAAEWSRRQDEQNEMHKSIITVSSTFPHIYLLVIMVTNSS